MTSPDNKSLAAYQKAMGQRVGEWEIDPDVGTGIRTRIPFVGDIIDALQGFVINGPFNFLSQLFHLRWAQVDQHDGEIVAISTEQQQMNTRLDDLESFQGTGITTPLWTSIGGRDIATFPDSMMLRVEHQDRTGGNN